MLTFEKLEPGHFNNFDPIDIQDQETKTTIDFVRDNDIGPHNVAVIADGKVVLIVGIFEIWDKVFSSYTLFSKHWKPIYYKYISAFFLSYLKYLDYDRIQHMVSCDRDWTHKMARFFGFKLETPMPMKKYMYGKDYYMYALVREDGT